MTIIGSAHVQIRADDKLFEPDVRKAVAKIKNVSIKLAIDGDIAKASKKIRDLRYRVTNNPAILQIDADTTKAERKMVKLLEKFNTTTATIRPEIDTTSIQEAIDEVSEGLNLGEAVIDTQAAEAAIDELTNEPHQAVIDADADTAAAEAQLTFAARNRTSNVRLKIDQQTEAALKGLFNTLTGTLPIDKVRGAISGVAANFEGLVVKSTAVISALTALGGVLTTTGANLFSVADDVLQVSNLIGFLPAGIVALTAILKVNKLAWKGFGDASKDNSKKANEALAKLPPTAQEAALAVREARKQISTPVQTAFWDTVGKSLTNLVTVQAPLLASGLSKVSVGLGAVTKSVFDTLSNAGDFHDVFANIKEGLFGISEGIGPAIEGFLTFAGVGSTFLPAFGKSLGEAGEKFGKFAKDAQESGDMLQWMETGIRRLKELTSIAGSTVGIFSSISQVAKISGAPGLNDVAVGFARVAEITSGEPFQSRLLAILSGARTGTDKLGEGLRTLTDLFSESAESVGSFLALAGEIAGLSFEGITTLFDGTGLGSGLYEAMSGLRDALVILEPGFRDFGTVIGDLGEIAGELFRSMAPGLNLLAETLSGVVAGLKDGIIGAMPVLNEFVQAVVGLASGPIVGIAEAVGNLLEVFANLPGGLQTAIASFGLFLLLKPKFDAMFNGIRGSSGRFWQGVTTDAAEGGRRVQNNLGRTAAGIRSSWVNVSNAFNGTDRVWSTANTGMERLSHTADAARRAIGTSAGGGLRLAAGGAMSLLGGPWGVALAGATAAVGLYAAEQAEAKAKVDALAGSLDQQSGAFTGASKKLIASDILDLDATAWDDFFRSGRRNMEELAEATNLNMNDVTEAVSNPEGRDAFVKNWQAIRDAAGNGNEVTEKLAKSVGMTAEQFEGLNDADLREMTRQIENAAETAAKAEKQVAALAKATGTSTIEAQRLSANYETLASTTSSVSQKFGALKDNLDILNGGSRTAMDTQRDYQQSLRDTGSSLTDIASRQGVVVQSLVNAKGEFDFTQQAGSDLYDTLSKSADSILKVGVSAFDAARKGGATLEAAQATATQSMAKPLQTFRDSLKTFGLSEPVIQGVIDQLGLVPSEIETALLANGDEAIAEAARTQLAMEAFKGGNYTAVLAALPDKAKTAIGEALGMADEFASGDYAAILKALDETTGGKEAALAALLSFDGTDWEAHLKALNLVPEGVDAANASAKNLIPEKKMDLMANDLASSVMGNVNAYDINDRNIDLTADDLVSKVLNHVNASPLNDKNSQMTTKDLVTQVINDINKKHMGDKLSTAYMKDLASRVVDVVNAKGLNGKSNTLTTKDLVSSVIDAINAKPMVDKYSVITTEQRTLYTTQGNRPQAMGPGGAGGNAANGALVLGGNIFGGRFPMGRSFANGGILKAMSASVRSFANGGRENHVAQISRGQTPYRVWSEPETGGEAYLPLAKSKRPRSLKILEEVAKLFGYGLIQTSRSYANGGIESSKSASSGGSSTVSGSRVSSALLSSINAEIVRDTKSMNGIGGNIVAGLIAGVNAKRQDAVSNMKGLAGSLEQTIRTTLRIQSPSKTFLGLGKHIVDGLTIGIKTGIPGAVKQMSTLANKLYVAAADVRKWGGRSVTDAIRLINAHKKLSADWNKIPAWKLSTKIADQIQSGAGRGSRSLADLVRAREDVNFRLGLANKKLKELTDARKTLFDQISSAAKNEFKLGTNILSDQNTYVPELRFSDVKNYASGVAGRLKAFNGKLIALKKKGVHGALIAEVAGLGSVEGSAVADAILQGSAKDIKGLNSTYTSIEGLGNSIGNTAADAMYAVGIASSKGLIKGLEADSKALTGAINSLTNKLITQVKRNLGIKSPSRVFAELGKYTSQGFIAGLDAMQPKLDGRIDAMVNPDPKRRSIASALSGAGILSTTDTATERYTTDGTVVNVTVNPSAGMDERAVGRAAVRELNFALMSQ